MVALAGSIAEMGIDSSGVLHEPETSGRQTVALEDAASRRSGGKACHE
jgi:hypothetical protein